MTPYGLGTDIVDVRRIAKLREQRSGQFATKWFTPAEVAYCESQARPEEHFAGRFAAKEAVWKALGLAWDGPVPWRAIEVVRDERGRPGIRLLDDVARAAASGGIGQVLISISRSRDFATAVAIAMRVQSP